MPNQVTILLPFKNDMLCFSHMSVTLIVWLSMQGYILSKCPQALSGNVHLSHQSQDSAVRISISSFPLKTFSFIWSTIRICSLLVESTSSILRVSLTSDMVLKNKGMIIAYYTGLYILPVFQPQEDRTMTCRIAGIHFYRWFSPLHKS